MTNGTGGARRAAMLEMEAVLVQYGPEDTLADLVFDTAGALVVSPFGTDLFDAMTESLTRRLDRTDSR